MNGPMLRVLVVEDSPLARLLLRDMLDAAHGFEIAGEAADGAAAVELAARLKPDVVLMDLHLPKKNGLEATTEIMQQAPVPILIFTATGVDPEGKLPFAVLAAGAVDLFPKPRLERQDNFAAIADKLRARLRLVSTVRAIRRFPARAALAPGVARPQRLPRVLAIGASTGGPAAVIEALKDLPPSMPAAVLLVQHMFQEFMPGLVSWLAGNIRLPVKMAAHGDALRPGVVLVAPGNRHMLLGPDGRVALEDTAPVHSCRPSADLLFNSVAAQAGSSAIGVLLTGMGDDGAEGLLRLRRAGAVTAAQDEASCAVYGMPRAAAELGAAEHILPPAEIGRLVARCLALEASQ